MTETITRPDTVHEYVPYEYLTVRTTAQQEPLTRDTYHSLGWTLEDRVQAVPTQSGVTLKFKRDRRIENRSVMSELQREAEQSLASIAALERSKGARAMAASLVVGIVGSGFLAGAVFAIMAGAVVLSIPLGALGLIGWVLGYLAHGKVRASTTARVAPQIDREYENLYSIGERADRILS